MQISSHGAARGVTGSCHLLELDGYKVLLDCGMFQGGKERHELNREPFAFDPQEIDCVLLSHAHIDHSGRLPLLYKAGYRGPVYTTTPSAELVAVLLRDSGYIHEEDARWKIKRLKKKGEDYSWVTPLFTREDADRTLGLLEPVEFDEPIKLHDDVSARFIRAGHILGAAIVEVNIKNKGVTRRLIYSGDLGVEGARLMSAPAKVERPDYLLIESTYGNRQREGKEDRTEELYETISKTINRGGKVIIPSFAVGRSQEILARINDLVESGRLRNLRVYLDSPMAVAATAIFESHPEAYSHEALRKLEEGDEPLEFSGLTLTGSVEESIEINRSDDPCVIISASGMCTAGRIKHHLKHNISDEENTILFVGYQAAGTLGQKIQSGGSPIRIFGEWYKVRAEVETNRGYSAHADQAELLAWHDAFGGAARRTFVIHGEEKTALEFASILEERSSCKISVPKRGEKFPLD